MIERLRELYESGEVRRLHTVPVHHAQTVAEHVYGSLLIAVELCRAEEEDPGAVLLTLLYHDAPELVTGDVPAPVKRESPLVAEGLAVLEAQFYLRLGIQLPELSPRGRAIVHASDNLDLAMTCLRERTLGNRHPVVGEVFHNVMRYLLEHTHVPAIDTLRTELLIMWLEDS